MNKPDRLSGAERKAIRDKVYPFDDATPLNNVPELIDKIQVETATKARDDTFQKTLEVVGEWAIEQRHILKTEKVKQKEKKPNDISSQIMYGAKAKVFQQVIDKIKALGQLEKE